MGVNERARRAAGGLVGADLAILIVALAVALAAWGFVLVAGLVERGGTESIDAAILGAMRRPDDPGHLRGPAWVEEVARDLTALGGIAMLGLTSVAAAGYLLLRRSSVAMWFVIVTVVGGLGLSTLLKHLYDRPRPSVVPHLSGAATASFPSGHSMLAAVVYLTVGVLLAVRARQWRVRVYVIAVALLVTLLVGVSRVAMGVHHPTDVLAGWSIGLAWALLCGLAARRLAARRVMADGGQGGG